MRPLKRGKGREPQEEERGRWEGSAEEKEEEEKERERCKWEGGAKKKKERRDEEEKKMMEMWVLVFF